MNGVMVYCEVHEGRVAEVSLELLTKGRDLAARLGVELQAVAVGASLEGVRNAVASCGANTLYLAQDARLTAYTTAPWTRIITTLFEKVKPQIVLFGATAEGRDLAPRISSQLHSGLTADCTQLTIGDHTDPKTQKEYKDLLYQIRPAFGGNIIATIINPEHRPQMATVREGVMRYEPLPKPADTKVEKVDTSCLQDVDFVVRLLQREMEPKGVNLKGAPIIVSGGYGVGSREGFDILFDLAKLLGGEVAASRAAVDAGFADRSRQVGQTGVTVRPKVYIACGISGQVQHTAGMAESSVIISINTDPEAPINQLADYAIVGDVHEVVTQLIASYKRNAQ